MVFETWWPKYATESLVLVAPGSLVLVVSEERGTVSLVMGGALTPVADTNELRERLQEIFSPEEIGSDGTPSRLALRNR